MHEDPITHQAPPNRVKGCEDGIASSAPNARPILYRQAIPTPLDGGATAAVAAKRSRVGLSDCGGIGRGGVGTLSVNGQKAPRAGSSGRSVAVSHSTKPSTPARTPARQ
jgi:hypothetical protein